MKSICVYCGSSVGNDPDFEREAFALGQAMALQNIRLVYGGAKIGLMGAVARGVKDFGGEVTGVIPKFLDHIEISNNEATELIITESMHERKTIMADKAEVFVALPGGMGTLEEITEILTWSQLGLVNSPIGFLNIKGYYDELMNLFRSMNKKGLLKDEHMELFVCADTVEDLMDQLSNFKTAKTSFRNKLGLT